MRDVKTFPGAFWLLALSCVIVYGAVLPANNIAQALLVSRDTFPQGSLPLCAAEPGARPLSSRRRRRPPPPSYSCSPHPP